VGIGLMFATAVKFILVPAQIVRSQRGLATLGFMLLGGVPGVIVGSLFLENMVTPDHRACSTHLGLILVTRQAGRYSFFPP